MHTSVSIVLLSFLVACAAPMDAAPPTAHAGEDLTASLGDRLRLEGAASQGEDLRYHWRLESIPSGSSLGDEDLAGADTPWPAFTPDVPGDYGLALITCDAWSRCARAEVNVLVQAQLAALQHVGELAARRFDGNQAPEAQGSASVRRSGGASAPWVFLNGQESLDPDGDPLRYTWTFASRPAESTLNLGDIEGQGEELAAFRPDAPGTWVLRLTVSDLNASTSTLLDSILIDQASWDQDLPSD